MSNKVQEIPSKKLRRLSKALSKAKTREEILELKLEISKTETYQERQKNLKLKASRTNRVKRVRTTALFMPKFTEGKKVFASLLNGKAKDVEVTDETMDKITELVAMLTEDTLLAKYTNWEMRAVALGLTSQRLYTLRQTKAFQTLLVQAIRGQAMVGAASAVGPQTDLARTAFAKGSTAAFSKLAGIAGLEGPKTLKMTQNNITFEQALRKTAMDAVVVDAEVVGHLPPAKK